MIKHLSRRLALLALGTTVLLSGCDTKPATNAAANTSGSVKAASAPKTLFSINEMMVMIVDHPGELLWDVEKGHAPKSAEEWYQLETHAVALASAATVIQLGGTGPNDMMWADQPEWKADAERLGFAAVNALRAAQSKDLPALVKANGQIVDSCEACHAKFKSDIPTGKLFIHRRPGIDIPA
jgi:cytochrome c556